MRNIEEAVVQLSQLVAFLLEEGLKSVGGYYSRVDDRHPHVADDNPVTGQHPASSDAAVLEILTS